MVHDSSLGDDAALPGVEPVAPRLAGSNRPGALVLGGALGSLDIVRSLGRRGIPVRFLTSDNTIALYSCYLAGGSRCPAPSDPGAVEWLLDYGRSHGLHGWALFPGGDPEVRLVAEHHAALSGMFRVTIPPWEIVRWAHDKRLTYQRAEAVGVDFPRVFQLRDRADAETGEFRFPLVLKPSSRDSSNEFTRAKAWRAADRHELIALFDRAAAIVGAGGVVCQEYIPGGGATQFSFAALCESGKPLAWVAAQRRRQYPSEVGTGTFVETCRDDDMAAAASRFLGSLDYTGLVELEFKYDVRDRRYKLLDVNPRLWNWISLGHAAGVDFSYLAWRQAVGEPVDPVEGRPGVAWMYASRDAFAVAQLIAARQISIAEYARSLRLPLRPAVFAKDDPFPAFIDLPVAVSRLVSRRLRGLVTRAERKPPPEPAAQARSWLPRPASQPALPIDGAPAEKSS